MEATSSLIFITGGVRSGKSTFAEKTAIQLARKSGLSLHYIATGVRSDSEMVCRIQRHQRQRQESEVVWRTWEQPRDVGKLANRFSEEDIVLLDCMTTLLNNELFSRETIEETCIENILQGIQALNTNCHTLIVVSNELLNEPIADDGLVFTYKKMLGHLHQRLVKGARKVYMVESGVANDRKAGRL